MPTPRGDGLVVSRRSSHVDISPLYASVIALLAASTASLEEIHPAIVACGSTVSAPVRAAPSRVPPSAMG